MIDVRKLGPATPEQAPALSKTQKRAPSSGLHTWTVRFGLLAPALILVGFLIVWPLISTTLVSFFTFSATELYVQDLTLENYAALTSGFNVKAFGYTISLALVTTAGCVLLGYPPAYLLSRSRASRRTLYLFLLVTPLMVGTVLQTYGWIILFSREGLVNDVLMFMGLTDEPERLVGSHVAVVVGLVNHMLPFMIVALCSSLNKVPRSLEEAAASLGARPLEVFRRVTLPLSRPGLVSGSVIVFVLSMSTLVTPLYLGSPSSKTVGVLIWESMLNTLDWPRGAALSVTLLLLTGLMAALFFAGTGRRKGAM